MNTVRNPFTSMLLTFNPANFYGRENEIIGILQVITAPEPGGHAIYGIRTIGKTTLLKYLKDEHGALQNYEDYISAEYRVTGWRRLFFTYITFHDFQKTDRVFWEMLRQLHEDIQKDIDLNSSLQLHPLNESATTQELLNTLRQIVAKLDDLEVRVVFLLDDFDEPLQYIDPDDDHLLRSLADEAPLIIATERPISEIRPDIGASSPLLGILRPESIALLSESAARQMISDQLRGTNILFSVDEEDFLIRVAGRQPFLLIAACELYFDIYRQYPDISDVLHDTENLQNLQRQFMIRLAETPHVKSLLRRTWVSLSQNERETLRHLTTANNNISMMDQRASIAAQLENRALVYWDVSCRTYRVFGTLFANFIRQQYGPRLAENGSGSIVDVIDDLSPIDQALARYLYDHVNEICTFETLLNTIWKDSDNKSKRALEAAVHRLRQHLGPHEEIKNIRGKGYTFVVNAPA